MNRFMVTSKIEEIEFIENEYWWLKTDQAFICINNPIKVVCGEEEKRLEDIDKEDIVNHEVIREKYSRYEYFYFVLDNGYKFVVSLAAEDYCCPEAMSFSFHSSIEILILD